jgi:hypothetical protein
VSERAQLAFAKRIQERFVTMQNILRCSLVVCLATFMTIGPVSAAQWMDCDWCSPEPDCCSACGCDAYVPPCESCCSEEIEVVSAAADCCGEAVTQDAVPTAAEAEAPQPVQAEPEASEDPAPVETGEPEPAVVPEAEAPVAVEVPAEQPTQPEQDDVKDLFDTPITPPELETPAAQPEADLLDSPLTPPAIDPSPTIEESEPAEQSEPAEEEDLLDDLFGKVIRPDTLSSAGGLQSDFPRTWTDNTANYQCEARLLGVSQGKIVLAKADGSISRVPLRRLSDRDLGFVYQQVVSKREMLARQAEAEQLASVWSK